MHELGDEGAGWNDVMNNTELGDEGAGWNDVMNNTELGDEGAGWNDVMLDEELCQIVDLLQSAAVFILCWLFQIFVSVW